jgi:stage V sporulation protein D (sporulation-specific penicillin-binding protein)
MTVWENLNRLLKPKKIIRKNLHKRTIRVLAIVLVVGFGFSVYGLAYSQLIKGEYFKTKAETQQLSDTTITADRGVIYDSNMTVLAQSAAAWKVSLNAKAFSQIPKEAQETVYSKLEEILGLSREYIESKASYSSYNSVSLKTKVEKEAKDKLSEFTSTQFVNTNDKKTYYSAVIMIDDDVKRYYPYSTLASQIIGFTGTDNSGLSGLESFYNNTLTGVDGRVISAKSNSSTAQDIEYESVYEAKQGTSLVLTIDETIQRYLEDALSDCYETSKCASCCGIVMDVKTGGILAMSTQTGYDLNDPYTIYNEKTKETINAIKDEKERSKSYSDEMYAQWRNSAISDTYEPGSVFKVITMAAGLEENVVKYDETYTCTGGITIADRHYFCHNHSGHGTQTLTQGLMNSCNPFFITIGQRLGVDTFYKYFQAFGFTEKTGIDLPGEASPVEGVTYFKKDTMTKVNLASSSFGQSFQVTPIQMLTAINAVANGGKLMQPYVVAKTLDSDGNTVSQTSPIVKRQVISESTSEKILASMEQVSIAGTAKNSYIAGYHMAGKTGTSDKLNDYGKYIASFAGCAPSYDPDVSIIIVVDEPQGATGGGAVAAPVAAEVVENTLTYLNVERRYNDSEKALLDKQVPNLVGFSVNDAKSTISKSGFKVKVVGDGDSVISQMPAYGQYIPQGGVVVVYTDNEGKKARTYVPDFTGMTVSQANAAAVNAGINIKVSGNSLSATGLTAYRQSIAKSTEIECGSTITVYFRTTTGVTDN